jgi:Zn-dependent protease
MRPAAHGGRRAPATATKENDPPMGLLKLLTNEPVTFILLAVPLVYSIVLHELAHGWVAWRMGDPTAKMLGRLSLNPIRHIDPIGTLMLFLFGFGWAKPVPVNFRNLRDTRKGLIFVSAAGIVMNMILAFAALLVHRLVEPAPRGVLWTLLYFLAQINIMLAAFNLIPIPPLDGSKILLGFSSGGLQRLLLQLERFGFFIVLGLLYLGVLDPLINFFRALILAVIRLLLP